MRRRLIGAILALALTSGFVDRAGAQSTETRIDQLRETIAKLESVERDPATPPELKEINHRFLVERRRLLQTLLQDRLTALRQYLTNLKSALSADEIRTVEQSIQTFEQHLAQLTNVHNPDVVTGTGNGMPGGAADRQPADTSAIVPPADSRTPVTGAVAASSSPSNTDSASPVAAVSISPPASAPAPVTATADDLPTPQDCTAYKANPATFSLYEKYVCDLVDRIKTRKASGQTPIELTGPQFFNLSVILVAQKLRSAFLVDAEEARTDKQVGSNSSNSGTTSLVTKGGTPSVLGFAVENGALEREISGTTITFRGNPVGLVEALQNKGFISSFEDDSPATRFLRKSSFAFSFDTDRGSQPGIFTGSKQQLSSVSARFEFINKRDPRLPEYRNDWENFLSVNAQPFLTTLVNSKAVFIETVVPAPGTPAVQKWRDRALEDWFEETQAEITQAAPGNVETVMKAQLAKLPIDELSTETVTALNNFARDFGVYLQGRQRILDKVAKGTIATFEYTNKREVNAPDTSNFMGIYETTFGGKADFTFNGSLTLFNSRPAGPNIGRLRDFQFAGQLDLPFGSVTGAGQYLLSVSGKYERLAEDASSLAGILAPNTKGDIALGQIKLTVPIKGLGIRFPISVTFANRTELVKEKTIRGNFGFTFDLDTILARFKPF